MKHIAEYIINNRFIFLTGTALLTLFFLYHALAGLTIRTVYSDLLPTNHAYVHLHNEIRDRFGGANQIVILVQVRDVADGGAYEDIFNHETLSTVKAIEEAAVLLPAVDRNKIMSLASRKMKDFNYTSEGIKIDAVMFPDVPDTPEGLEALRAKVYGLPWCYPGMISLDSKKTIIVMDFFEDRIDYRLLFNELRALRARYENDNIIIAIAGEPMHLGYIDHYVMDVVKILLCTVLAMMIVLFICFRSRRGMCLPILAAGVSAVWGLGFMGLAGINLDPLVLVFPFLIAAMAASHSVQIMKRYAEASDGAADSREAAAKVIEQLARPGAAGIITDCSGIMVIALIPIPVLQKIALPCAFWALATVAVVLILVPILLSCMPLTAPRSTDGFLDRLLCRTGVWITARGKYAVLVLTGLLLVWGGWFCTKIDIGSSMPGSEVLWPWHRYNVDCFRISFAMPLLNPLYIIVQGDTVEAVDQNPALWRELELFMRYMRQTPDMRVVTAQSLLMRMAGSYRFVRDNDPNWIFSPLNDEHHKMFYRGIIWYAEPGTLEQYVDVDLGALNILLFCRDKTPGTISAVFDRIYDFMREESLFGLRAEQVHRQGFDRFVHWCDGLFRQQRPEFPAKPPIEGVGGAYYRLAGGAVGVQAAINETLTLYQVWTLILALLTVFLLCTAVFRSWTAGIIIVTPLMLSSVLAFAFMALSRPFIALTTSTLPVASLGIGLGVNYGIYLVSRISEEYRSHGMLDDAIRTALGTTGKAIVYIACTLICGIIFWFFSKMMFQAMMGLLLVIILFFNMLGALFIIPAAIAVIKPKFITCDTRG
jgi:uncharacterized protein